MKDLSHKSYNVATQKGNETLAEAALSRKDIWLLAEEGRLLEPGRSALKPEAQTW